MATVYLAHDLKHDRKVTFWESITESEPGALNFVPVRRVYAMGEQPALQV
jgi:hypothetical protein